MKLKSKTISKKDLLLFFRKAEEAFSKQGKTLCVLHSDSEAASSYLPNQESFDASLGEQTHYIAFLSNNFDNPQDSIYFLFTEDGSFFLEFNKASKSNLEYTAKGYVGVFETVRKFQEFESALRTTSSTNYNRLEQTIQELNLGNENMFLMNQILNQWNGVETIAKTQ